MSSKSDWDKNTRELREYHGLTDDDVRNESALSVVAQHLERLLAAGMDLETAVTQTKYKYYLSDAETELIQEMAEVQDDKKVH